MPPGLEPLFLYLAGVAGVAAFLCFVCSREASIDVRVWLTVAVVAASLYAAMRFGAHPNDVKVGSRPPPMQPSSGHPKHPRQT